MPHTVIGLDEFDENVLDDINLFIDAIHEHSVVGVFTYFFRSTAYVKVETAIDEAVGVAVEEPDDIYLVFFFDPFTNTGPDGVIKRSKDPIRCLNAGERDADDFDFCVVGIERSVDVDLAEAFDFDASGFDDHF